MFSTAIFHDVFWNSDYQATLISLMTTVILKAAGYCFKPTGFSKCNIWVTAKLCSAYLISSVAQKFSQWHQSPAILRCTMADQGKTPGYFAPPCWGTLSQKLQPGESPRVIYMHNHTIFQHGVSVFLLRYWAQDPNKTELAYPGTFPSNNRCTYQNYQTPSIWKPDWISKTTRNFSLPIG